MLNWCWTSVSTINLGSPSRGVLWSLSTAAKSEEKKREREKSTLVTLRALSFEQRVQGGFTDKSFTTGCQMYIWVSPVMGIVLIFPQIQRSLWKCLKQTLNYQDYLLFLWKWLSCENASDIKVNHSQSLLASSRRVKRKWNSSFFSTKWIRTSFNLLHITCSNGAQPNVSLSLFFKKKQVKHILL